MSTSVKQFLDLIPTRGSKAVRFVVTERGGPAGYQRIAMNSVAFDQAIPTNDRIGAQADLMAQAYDLLPRVPGARLNTYYVDASKQQHSAFAIHVPIENSGGGASPMMDVNARLADAAAKFLAAGGAPEALANIQPTAIGLAVLESMLAKLATPAPTQGPAQDGDVPF